MVIVGLSKTSFKFFVTWVCRVFLCPEKDSDLQLHVFFPQTFFLGGGFTFSYIRTRVDHTVKGDKKSHKYYEVLSLCPEEGSVVQVYFSNVST